MKKILFILMLLVTIPSMVFAGNAVPYSDEALQNVIKAISENSKEGYDPEKMSKEEFHGKSVEYFTTVFDQAGYSFNDTIIQIVDDMQNNLEAIPTDRETIYNKVYMLLHILIYQCNYDKVDCYQFFTPDAKKSIQWLMENSNFSKQGNNKHHMMK